MASRLSLLLASLFVIDTNAQLKKISSLPGYTGKLPVMYGGYINYTSPVLNSIHYTYTWVVESSNGAATSPTVVWFQGGPGCSGLFGFGFENGAFMATATPNSTTDAIQINPLGWNNNFNMIFLEQPVGVGFSYSDTKKDYSMFNDTISAADNYAWLQAFMNAMPQYSTQPLWLAGESYGGAYIPQLSYAILTGKNTALIQQFAGVLIGNPVLSCPDSFINIVGLVQADILFHHSLVPQSARDDYVAQGCAELYPKDPNLCNTLYSDLLNLMGPINPDNEWSNEMNGGNGTLGLYVGPAAIDRDANWATYLNRPDVQAAIGAKSPVFPPWNDCVMDNGWQYDATFPSSLPQYTALFQAGKQVLIYSGDVDVATCPFAGTQYCLNQMNRPVLSGWTSWNVNGQQAGYVQQYDVMTFATVKGGGHEAPGFQPLASYEMVNRFITTGNLLGTSTKDTDNKKQDSENTNRAMNGRIAQSERLRMAMKKAIENGVNRKPVSEEN